MIKVRKKPLEKCLGTYSFLRFQYCSHVEKIPTNLVMMSMTVCFDIFSRAFLSLNHQVKKKTSKWRRTTKGKTIIALGPNGRHGALRTLGFRGAAGDRGFRFGSPYFQRASGHMISYAFPCLYAGDNHAKLEK